jgi:hypothetical protein
MARSCDGAVMTSLASLCVCLVRPKPPTRRKEWIVAWRGHHQREVYYVFAAQPRRLRLVLKRRGWRMHAYLTLPDTSASSGDSYTSL